MVWCLPSCIFWFCKAISLYVMKHWSNFSLPLLGSLWTNKSGEGRASVVMIVRNLGVKRDIVVSQLSTWHPQSDDINQTVLDLNSRCGLTPDVFPPQGPDVFSGEQDVGLQSGCGSGPDSVSDSEPGSAQTHQRVHHPSHTVVSGKHVTQYKYMFTYSPATVLYCIFSVSDGLSDKISIKVIKITAKSVRTAEIWHWKS